MRLPVFICFAQQSLWVREHAENLTSAMESVIAFGARPRSKPHGLTCHLELRIGRGSKTPSASTSQLSTTMHLQFVFQYFQYSGALKKGKHLLHSIWESSGGWGHRDAPQSISFIMSPATASRCAHQPSLVAQCSATPATVAATPPCSATPFQTQISVRQLPGTGGGRCDTKIFRGCSATPVLHL